jgi:hypothetical protein
MGINNNPTFLPFGDRKHYQKPAIWVDNLPPISIFCAGSGSANTGQGGDSNEDHSFWDENEDISIWDEDPSFWNEDEVE